ncbi:hypothetical protein J3R30DRAFT_3402487 [Lentinula aciculospora]|uniref:BTB domain-containing protein n=1 Tax=Lentinula aciculospora TaxID=153920 RepID=A0A9W9DTM0_9AGAR|nr:hypothetical protein J3R30DRAFT_3402487 [Lentinula aciculospora]
MSDRSLEHRHLNIVKKYYMAGGDLFFQVHRYFFDRESPKFQEMLSRPPPTGQAAYGSLNNPVVLDVTSEEFQQLLWVFYNPVYSYEEAKLEDWGCILSLACRYKFPEVKKLAVRNLEKFNLDLVEQISLYQECSADEDLLIPLYAHLCARDRTLSLAETHRLGYETAVMVFQAREHLRSPADRGKSPLPDDIEEGEVEDTIRDLMKDLFSGNPNDNRKSISASGWAAAYEEALATINMEPKSRSIRRIPRPLPPPAPSSETDEMDGLHKMETITEVSTVRTGRTDSLSSEVTNSKRRVQNLNGVKSTGQTLKKSQLTYKNQNQQRQRRKSIRNTIMGLISPRDDLRPTTDEAH